MKDLTSGNIYKTFIVFAIPLIFSGLFSMMTGTIDTMMIGSFLGENEVAACSATSSFTTFIQSMLWGFAQGLGIYVAKKYGEKHYQNIRSAILSTVLVYLIVTIVISLVCVFSFDFIAKVLNIDNEILADTKTYFIVIMSGLFFFSINSMGVFVFNALGMSLFPFIAQIISTVVNIVGNFLSIVVFKIGVLGVALSSVFSVFIITIFYTIKLWSCFKKMGLKGQPYNIKFKHVKAVSGFGLPILLQQSITYLAGVIVAPFVNGIGKEATAGLAIINLFYNFVAILYVNSTRVVENYCSQSIGARKFSKIKKAIPVGLLQNTILVVPVILLLIIFVKPVTSLFLNAEASAVTKEYVYMFVRICLPFALVRMVSGLFHSFFRGVKAMKVLTISSFISAGVRTIVTVIAVTQLGMLGVIVGWISDWVVEFAFILIVYLTNKWKTSNYIALENECLQQTEILSEG